MHSLNRVLLLSALVALLMVGCGSAATPIPAPTWTPQPTYTPYPIGERQPTYTPYPTNVPQATYIPYPTSVPLAAISSPVSTVAPVGKSMYVCAGGEGVYLRSTMDREQRMTAYADDSQMVVLANPTSDWTQVRAPDGALGFVPTEYLCGAPKTVEVKPTKPAALPPPVVPVAPPPPSPMPVANVRFLAVNGASVNGTASVSVQTTPGAACSIVYVTPAGSTSTAQGLGSKYADANGQVYWSWKIGSNTHPGTGKVSVTCGGTRITSEITIR
jgi:hypothetical protein